MSGKSRNGIAVTLFLSFLTSMAVSLLVLFAASRHFGAGGGSAGNGNNPGTRLQLPGGGTGIPGPERGISTESPGNRVQTDTIRANGTKIRLKMVMWPKMRRSIQPVFL